MNKTKIIICGISGKMGGNVLSLLENDGEAEAVCGVDPFVKSLSVPVYAHFSEVKEDADVIVDFSSAENLEERAGLRRGKKHRHRAGLHGLYGGGQ